LTNKKPGECGTGSGGDIPENPPERLVATFGRAELHRHIGELIKRRSSNKGDVYKTALASLKFDRPIRVLDLGCAWGAFTAALGGIAPAGSASVGVDWIEENRTAYLASASRAGLSGSFVSGPVEAICSEPDRGFDLVLSGFSLYFFTGALPEIARVLRDDGVFVAITHSERSLGEFLEDVRIPLLHDERMTAERFGVEEVLREFSAENGLSRLSPHFGSVETQDFKNRLTFGVDEIDECFEYLLFKRCILTESSEYRRLLDDVKFHGALKDVMRARAEREGAYTLTKDDAIFRCRSPRGGGGAR
jgi:ubiquinone/menaquinone biosynthesis C-methylase UbiE